MSSDTRKVALVTGGSRGIGRAICEELAKGGMHVLVNYSTKSDAADETAALCEKAGGSAETLGFNVAQSEHVDAAFEVIKEKFGKLDILVNNAGVAHEGLFIRMKDQDWNDTLAVNLSGSFYCARSAAKLMIKSRTGRIINVSSVVGEMGNAGQAAYVSAKSGVIGLTKAISRELAMRNITVNAVTPGFIETDMTKDLDEKLKAKMLEQIPLQRFGSAHEVAALVAFLASDAAGYLTGQVIGVNGGMYM